MEWVDVVLVDTFPAFLERWNGDEESWLEYIRDFPELFEKIRMDYEKYGNDWRDYLRLLSKRELPELKRAHERLVETIPGVGERIEELFGVGQEDYNIVIYVGLENGAGWVTEFMGKPSILFGLEAIAELGWYDNVRGLVAHEFGHLVHWIVRGGSIEELENEEIMWLYTEGFAQRIEDIVTGRPWHLESEGWFEWCVENERLIKKEFLRRLRANEPLNRFFGSWYRVFGRRFLGYYLGYRFVEWLETEFSLRGIALMDRVLVRDRILEFLEL